MYTELLLHIVVNPLVIKCKILSMLVLLWQLHGLLSMTTAAMALCFCAANKCTHCMWKHFKLFLCYKQLFSSTLLSSLAIWLLPSAASSRILPAAKVGKTGECALAQSGCLSIVHHH